MVEQSLGSDPLGSAIELVDAARSMPAAEAARYLHLHYRIADAGVKESIALALIGALAGAREQLRAAERAA